MSRAQETRRRLIDQGRTAFAAKGHADVSIQRDVLAPTGISSGSFYHQFDDKTALLIAILEEASEMGRYLLPAAAVDETTVETTRLPLEYLFDILDGADDLFRIAIREAQSTDERVRGLLREMQNKWIELLTQRLRPRLPHDSASDLETVAVVVYSMCLGMGVHYLDLPEADRPAARKRYLDAMSVFVHAGVTALATDETAT